MPDSTVFLSAGEASGDLHGAGLARALRQRIPGVRLIGLGGSRMAAEGVQLLAGLDELAVMGIVEVGRRLPFFLRLRRRVFRALREEQVRLVVPIDYPGFNLRLARRARILQLPVLWYIAPQVWAWKASRTGALARDTAGVAAVLPFEEAFLRQRGVNARFVGHPLLDRPEPAREGRAWAERHGLHPHRPILALFPGSRGQEIQRHLELFSEAARRVTVALPEVQPVIGTAPDAPADAYAGSVWPRIPGAAGLLAHSRAALVKSGTTTLEGALAGTPMVVAYRMNPLSFAFARRVVRVPHVALANLIAGERVVPELLQGEATPERLGAELLPLLDLASPQRRCMTERLGRIRERLGSPGAAERVAGMAAALLDEGG